MGNTYVGVDDKARLVKGIYLGVDNKAKLIKNIFIGVNNVARKIYTSHFTISYDYSDELEPIYYFPSSITFRLYLGTSPSATRYSMIKEYINPTISDEGEQSIVPSGGGDPYYVSCRTYQFNRISSFYILWIECIQSFENKEIKTTTYSQSDNYGTTDTWKIYVYQTAYQTTLPNSSTQPTEYEYGQENVYINEPRKIGYNFVGWKGWKEGYTRKLRPMPTDTYGDLTLKPVWEPISYNIHLHEEEQNDHFIEYNVTTSNFYLPVTGKLNYTFVGWKESEISDFWRYNTLISKGSIGNRGFYPQWEKKKFACTITWGNIVNWVSINSYLISQETVYVATNDNIYIMGTYAGQWKYENGNNIRIDGMKTAYLSFKVPSVSTGSGSIAITGNQNQQTYTVTRSGSCSSWIFNAT